MYVGRVLYVTGEGDLDWTGLDWVGASFKLFQPE